MSTAGGIARNLGARRQGNNWRCACPRQCGYALSLRDGEDGRLLIYCFGGCSHGDIITSLVEHGLLDDDDDVGDRDVSSSAIPCAVEDPLRSGTARWIYDHLAPAAGTPAERYLRGRAITLPVPSSMRFGACPHRLGGLLPAMAVPVIDVNGDQTGIHMTYLRVDGSAKADLGKEFQRECRGMIGNGAIHLAQCDPSRELVVGEGIETTLSAMEIFDLPGWAAVSASGLKTLELPATVRRIMIAADNDASSCGQRNAAIAMRRWQGEGRVVRTVLPTVSGDDFNNVLIKRRRG
jgi:hypothetical protein